MSAAFVGWKATVTEQLLPAARVVPAQLLAVTVNSAAFAPVMEKGPVNTNEDGPSLVIVELADDDDPTRTFPNESALGTTRSVRKSAVALNDAAPKIGMPMLRWMPSLSPDAWNRTDSAVTAVPEYVS